VRVLNDIGSGLVAISPAFRRRELQTALERVAAKLPSGPLCLPLQIGPHGGALWVLSVCPDEAAVFSTNKRAPFKCVVEVCLSTSPCAIGFPLGALWTGEFVVPNTPLLWLIPDFL
jgi:hypothetical protein